MEKVAPSAPPSRKRKLEGGERGPRRRLRIGDLPDVLIGDIVSRLPLKEGARTQVLSKHWRSIWRGYAALNLDSTDLGPGVFDVGDLTMEHVLSLHPGPGRRFTLRASYTAPRPTAAKLQAWLMRPALRDLQHLQLRFDKRCWPPSERPPNYSTIILEPLPEAVQVLAKTLKILDVLSYAFSDAVQGTSFRCIKYLTLENVRISAQLFSGMITGSPALGSIMLSCIVGMDAIHITSSSIRSIGFHVGSRTQLNPPGPPAGKLVIGSCPLLKRLLNLDERHVLHTTLLDAPRLEAIGFISDLYLIQPGPSSSLTMTGSLSIQGLEIGSLVSKVRSVKILAISMGALDLDKTINMLECFPCLERLYVQV